MTCERETHGSNGIRHEDKRRNRKGEFVTDVDAAMNEYHLTDDDNSYTGVLNEARIFGATQRN